MKRLILHLLCIASCASIASAQRSIDVTADVVQFRGSNGTVKWEFQYAFADTALRYVIAPSGFLGELYCRLELSRDTGLVHVDEWVASVPSPVATPSHRQYFSGVRAVNLTSGTYAVKFSARDVNDSLRRTTLSFKSVVPVQGLRPTLSDIMFVMPGKGSEKFLRNGVSADPNPRHEVIGAEPTLGIYAEIYNASQAKLGDFDIGVSVIDNIRDEQFVTYVPMKALSDGLVMREEFPLLGISSGVYYVRLQLLTKDHQTVLETKEDRFFLLNPEEPPAGQKMLTEDEQFQISEWSILAGEQLKLEMELSDILATKAELDVRKSCTNERAQQRYLFRFWKVRDPESSTNANERLDQFRANFKRAQTFYKSPTYPDGWRTDRGVILLKFGVPTQIERFDHNTDAKPYEKWFYQDIQGGVEFYFVDMMMQQNYKLVHSTMLGQISQPNWFNLFARAYSPNPNPVNPQPGLPR
jgi:GWxTD domain-containing protein